MRALLIKLIKLRSDVCNENIGQIINEDILGKCL